MNLRRLYQKSLLLPVVIALTYICLLLETVKYPGFIGNHFFIDAKVYFAAAVVLLLFLNTESKIMKFVFKVNKIFLVGVTLIYVGLNLAEGANFTNYVLNVFRIHLDGMVYLVLFSLSIFLIEKFKYLIPKSVKGLGILYHAMLFFIVLFMVGNLPYISDMAATRDSYIVFHLRDSYDEKMYYQWGDFYRFMVFVRENTPETATIVLPPMENPWLIGSGNPHFVRAFLYPRKIVQETKIISDLDSYGSDTYILITWGKETCAPEPECHGWPRQDIAAKKIIYKDPNSKKVVEIRENAIYDPNDKTYVYGLIKL